MLDDRSHSVDEIVQTKHEAPDAPLAGAKDIFLLGLGGDNAHE